VLYLYGLKLTETWQTACDAGVKLFRIVELLGELHSAVPPVGAGLFRFPHEASIHIPLYTIFSKYIDCLLFIISDVRLGQHCKSRCTFFHRLTFRPSLGSRPLHTYRKLHYRSGSVIRKGGGSIRSDDEEGESERGKRASALYIQRLDVF